MQGPALQNGGATVHVILKGERLSPTVGLMLQDGGGDISCPFVATLSGSNVGNKVDEAPNIGMVNSADPDKPSLTPKKQNWTRTLLASLIRNHL